MHLDCWLPAPGSTRGGACGFGRQAGYPVHGGVFPAVPACSHRMEPVSSRSCRVFISSRACRFCFLSCISSASSQVLVKLKLSVLSMYHATRHTVPCNSSHCTLQLITRQTQSRDSRLTLRPKTQGPRLKAETHAWDSKADTQDRDLLSIFLVLDHISCFSLMK